MKDLLMQSINDYAVAIEMLHRAGSGGLTLHAKECDENWKDLANIDLDEGLGIARAILGERAADVYVSINTFHAGKKRSSRNVKYINAAYADLDCHKMGMSPDEASSAIAKLIADGTLPQHHIEVRSGQGIWLLYLLADEHDTSMPLKGSRQNGDTHRRICGALVTKLQAFGADSKCVDLARVFRLPGFKNSNSGKAVKWYVPGLNVQPYSLTSLGKAFNLSKSGSNCKIKVKARRSSSLRRSLPVASVKHNRVPNRRNGYDAMLKAQLARFEALWRERGGFDEGHRNHAALIYATFYRNVHRVHESKLRRVVRRLGQTCNPPLSKSEVNDATRQGMKFRKFRYQTVSDWLEVTHSESKATGLPVASKWATPPTNTTQQRPQRTLDLMKRREAIEDYVHRVGHVPSVRNVQCHLTGVLGYEPSTATVYRDLKAMGLM
jgi:hypothetical protein